MDPTAWTASTCSGTPASAHRAAISAIGWTVPTSLLAHITATSAVWPGWAANSARIWSTSTRPTSSTSSHTTSAPSCSPSQCTGSRTAWCSMREASTRRRAGSCAVRDHQSPLTARLSASVPPAVKITSLGVTPSAAAIVSRDSSTRRRAARPGSVQRGGVAGVRRAHRSSPRGHSPAWAWSPRGRGRCPWSANRRRVGPNRLPRSAERPTRRGPPRGAIAVSWIRSIQ